MPPRLAIRQEDRVLKSLSFAWNVLILSLAALIIWTPAAYAYVDPMAAGTLLQAGYILAVSAFTSILLLPKRFMALVSRIRQRLFSGPRTNDEAGPAQKN